MFVISVSKNTFSMNDIFQKQLCIYGPSPSDFVKRTSNLRVSISYLSNIIVDGN